MSTDFEWSSTGSEGPPVWPPVVGTELGDDDTPESGAAQLSWGPVIVGAVALIASLALLPWNGGLPSIAGYVLTPFVVVFSLAKARSTYVRRLDDQWFDRGRARQRLLILQVLTGVAFVAALPHIWNLSKVAALWLQ